MEIFIKINKKNKKKKKSKNDFNDNKKIDYKKEDIDKKIHEDNKVQNIQKKQFFGSKKRKSKKMELSKEKNGRQANNMQGIGKKTKSMVMVLKYTITKINMKDIGKTNFEMEKVIIGYA